MSEILTDRLFMRPFLETDKDHFLSLKTKLVNMADTHVGVLDEQTSAHLLAEYVQHWHTGGLGMWALFHRQSESFIGECGFAARSGFSDLTLRYTLDHKWWGQGLASEAVNAVLDHGFKTELVEHVSALALQSNHRSCRILEQVGMNVTETAFGGVSGFQRYALKRP